MSIRDFNREYSTIGVGKCNLSPDEAMQLHCLMVRTICNLNTSELNENDMEVVTMLTNIHEIILKSSNNSAVIRECVDTLNKTVIAIPNKQFVLNRLRVLPIMTDMLEISPQLNTTELILKMLHDITFGVEITVVEPFLEKLLRMVVDIIVDRTTVPMTFDGKPPNEALRKAAVSVLINICSNNMAMLSLLSQKVNFVDFQKQVTTERYGILACKTNLMLNDCGHLLTDADIRNFLMFASKEAIKCMQNQDESTLKHLIGFVKDIASRPNTRHVLREYNFLADFEAAIMLLDKQDGESYSTQISALFELSSIILGTKNHSLANMRLTILNFAQRHIKTRNCCVKALKTLIAIFEFEDHVSTTNFELTELKQSLMDILTGNDFEPYIMIPVLKLLIVLGLKYRVEILNNVVVVAVLRPLIDAKKIVYSKLMKENVTMYLQCLVTMLKLSHIHTAQLNMGLLSNNNVRYVVAIALKIGNLEQRVLALELLSSPTHYPPNVMAELMAETLFDATEVASGETTLQCVPPPLMSSTMISNNVRDVASDDDSEKLIARIQKACDENKLNKVPVSDFIKLYEDRLTIQNQQIAAMECKLQEMSKDITREKHTSLRLETTMLRCTEMAKSLQGSNELLTRDKQGLLKTIMNLREDLNSAKDTIKQDKKTYAELESSIKDLKDANMKAVYELQTIIKNKSLEIENLNEKLKESDHLANTVVSLFAKRKK